VKSRKKNKRKAPKHARANTHDEPAEWADSFKDVLTGVGGLAGIGGSITPTLRPDRRRRWMRRRLRGVIRRLLEVKRSDRGGRWRKDYGRKSVQRGKFCQQVIDEIKRIKNLCVEFGGSVPEIQNEHPDFAVWKITRYTECRRSRHVQSSEPVGACCWICKNSSI